MSPKIDEGVDRWLCVRRRTWCVGLGVATAVVVLLAGLASVSRAASYDCQVQTQSGPPGYDLEDRTVANLGAFCEDIAAPSTPMGEFVHEPVDGRSSAACTIKPGGGPYDNVHCFTNLFWNLSFTPPLTFSVDFKLPPGSCNNSPTLSLVQGIEFSMSRYLGGRRWEWALQLENVNASAGDGAPQWRVWRPADASWQPIGVSVPTDLCDGGEWHTLQMQGRLSDSEQIHFDGFSLDGQPQSATITDRASVATPGEPDRFAAAVQVDSNSGAEPYTVYLDHLSLTPTYQIFGLDFSPYVDGQDPNHHSQVSPEQLDTRLRLISPLTRWVRSFGCADGLERTGEVAHRLGLKVALGAWISRDSAENDRQIACLIEHVNAGEADLAIVGSEALLRGDVPATTLVDDMNNAKACMACRVPVATADGYARLLENPAVMDASNVLLPDIYPSWEDVGLRYAMWMVDTRYQQLRSARPGKRSMVSETGWPSCGAANGDAVTSPQQNAADYFFDSQSWACANGVDALYFEALDESWKGPREPGGAEACWGIADTAGVLKPGMQRFFQEGPGPPPPTCGVPGGPGAPLIEFTRIPPYGSGVTLKGRELHEATCESYVAVYLRVAGGWWTKPTFADPRTAIARDGTWSTNVVTGGIDAQATDYAAFLLPNTYTPPPLGGAGNLPDELAANAIASVTVSRTSTRPVASFSYDPVNPVNGETVTFTSQATDPDGTIATVSWDFGCDGTTDADGLTAQHVFPSIGDACVAQTVADNTDDTDTMHQTVPVAPAPPPPPPIPRCSPTPTPTHPPTTTPPKSRAQPKPAP